MNSINKKVCIKLMSFKNVRFINFFNLVNNYFTLNFTAIA